MIWIDSYIYNEVSGNLFQSSSGEGFTSNSGKEYPFGSASGEGIYTYSNKILYECEGYSFTNNLKSKESLY